jgi:hypothetical protein
MDEIHESVRHRFRAQIDDGQVEVLRLPSVEAARRLSGLDWVYIDGDHTYEGVRADLAAWAAALGGPTTNGGTGGIIAGDDYGVRGWWEDGVTRAVDEFVAVERAELKVLGTQFMIRLRDRGPELGRDG